jgi:hypothetical protein
MSFVVDDEARRRIPAKANKRKYSMANGSKPTKQPGNEEERIVQFPGPNDLDDIGSLFEPDLGDPITESAILNIPIGKPRDFFRTHPDKAYRRRTTIYIHKPEGVVDTQYFIVSPAMQAMQCFLEEARPCNLVVIVDRTGSPRFWPIPLPRDGEHDFVAWQTAREVVRRGIACWVRPVWVKRAYVAREALEGYAPDPDWAKLPPYDVMVRKAFGENGVIRDEQHPMYQELRGAKPNDALD